MAQRKFEDLDLKDAFMFGAALEDPETCRISLEVMLGRKISDVTVHAEHVILYNSNYRGVRLDIYATDREKNRYNVEMQGVNKGNLPRRSRFYQAEMDVVSLKRGEKFNLLPPSYVIFVCDFDPFGKELYRYTFENRCKEVDFPLEDGAVRIFLSTKGKNAEEVPPELVNFLQYVENSTESCARQLEDEVVNRIHTRVQAIKKSREWEERYMLLEEWLDDAMEEGREEGRKEGIAEGQSRLQHLIEVMVEAGETALIPRLSDTAFLNEMYQKYHV